jgi:hypothetical protein
VLPTVPTNLHGEVVTLRDISPASRARYWLNWLGSVRTISGFP